MTPRLLFGTALFVFGLLLLLGNLELLELDRALHFFWPSAFVLIGLGQLFFGRTWYWGVVWVVAGGWLYLDELGLSPVSFWEILLPAVLVLLGINMVMRSLRGPRPRPEWPEEGEVVSAFALMAGN